MLYLMFADLNKKNQLRAKLNKKLTKVSDKPLTDLCLQLGLA
jgi:hypothetical protein